MTIAYKAHRHGEEVKQIVVRIPTELFSLLESEAHSQCRSLQGQMLYYLKAALEQDRAIPSAERAK